MKLTVTQTQGNGFTEVTAEHKGEVLVFSTSTYGKVKLNSPDQVFAEINRYWASLDAKRQDAIWNCYKNIKEYLESVIDSFNITRVVKRHVKELYSYMPMEELSYWLLVKDNLYIPSDIKDALQEDSRYPRLDQTYLKKDYIDLSVLALALRPILPIWGEFATPVRQGNIDDLYKEMEAVALLADTDVVNWPKNKPAFEKLLTYITITTEDSPLLLGNLWKGIGTAEMPMWLLSKVLVRRLPIVPLTDHTATHSIIANVYNYVRSNMKPADRRTSDRVADKRQDKSGSDEDDKTSFLEGYKVKQRVATGDAVLYNVYSENMAQIAQVVDPTIDLSLLNSTVECIPKLTNARVYQHQLRLAQWVLSKGFPPRAFYQINKASVNRLLAVTQAVLWHWGFLELACLMQVDRISTTDQDVPGITHRPRGGSRISRKYDDVLAELYPYSKPQKITPRQPMDPSNRAGNYAAIGINNLTRDIYRYDWYYHGPVDLHKLANQPEGRHLVVLPPKLKDQITELVIQIAKHNQ